MASISDICSALATTITDGVQSTLFSYSDVADVSELPAILIEPATADYEEAMARGTDCWWVNIYVICSKNDSTMGQAQLKGFITGGGPDSIREVVFKTPDAGLGDGTDITIMKMMGFGGTFSDASVPLVGAILKARVYTDGRA
jgi:hypothetical protein